MKKTNLILVILLACFVIHCPNLEADSLSSRERELQMLFPAQARWNKVDEIERDKRNIAYFFSLFSEDVHSQLYIGNVITFIATEIDDYHNIDPAAYQQLVLEGILDIIHDIYGKRFDDALMPPDDDRETCAFSIVLTRSLYGISGGLVATNMPAIITKGKYGYHYILNAINKAAGAKGITGKALLGAGGVKAAKTSVALKLAGAKKIMIIAPKLLPLIIPYIILSSNSQYKASLEYDRQKWISNAIAETRTMLCVLRGRLVNVLEEEQKAARHSMSQQ